MRYTVAGKYGGDRPGRIEGDDGEGKSPHPGDGAVILIGLGANRPGAWGPPDKTLERALAELQAPGEGGLRMRAVSNVYETAGVGPGRPGTYLNAVAAVEGHCPPGALLTRLKRIERRAGRRPARRWGPRALDLDILDYRGLVRGWTGGHASGHTARGRLVLPHPLLHTRPFVLAPLLDIAPRWRHPVLGRTARQLWHDVRFQRAGRILRRR